jgi:hypothetical protein
MSYLIVWVKQLFSKADLKIDEEFYKNIKIAIYNSSHFVSYLMFHMKLYICLIQI